MPLNFSTQPGTVFAVEGEDDLTIGAGHKVVFTFQLLADFTVVVNFTVYSQDQFTVLTFQRLAAGKPGRR